MQKLAWVTGICLVSALFPMDGGFLVSPPYVHNLIANHVFIAHAMNAAASTTATFPLSSSTSNDETYTLFENKYDYVDHVMFRYDAIVLKQKQKQTTTKDNNNNNHSIFCM